MNFHANHITRNIRVIYLRKLIIPLLYLSILAFVWDTFSFIDSIYPKTLDAPALTESYQKKGIQNVKLSLSDLYFTGYSNNHGYYYYTITDHTCYFFLLSPTKAGKRVGTKKDVYPYIKNITIYGHILDQPEIYQQLISNVANDLEWTQKAVGEMASTYIISEPDYRSGNGFFLLAVFVLTGAFAAVNLLLLLLYVLFPILSPPSRQLHHYGKVKVLLTQAQEEFNLLAPAATGNLFLTKHFLIEIGKTNVAVIPIAAILWIYPIAKLHQFGGYPYKISHTLTIVAQRRLQIRFTQSKAADMDKIIDFLLKENPHILVGFHKENRSKVFLLRHRSIAKIYVTATVINKFIQIRRNRKKARLPR
jgi:hypothetical protein